MSKTATLILALALILLGCKIQESDLGVTGAVYVTLSDTSGVPIERATIWVDGHETSQRTPSILNWLSVGAHVIGAARQDVYDVFDTVQVVYQDTVNLALETAYKPLGAIELVSAPDSTVLILNQLPSGTTPPSVLYVGIGMHLASLYLPGNATNLPARWTLTVVQNDTVRLSAGFTAVETGNDVGRLAPTFAGKIEFFGIDPNDDYLHFSWFRSYYHPELGLTFPLVHDMGQVIRGAYGVQQFPANFIVDQTGKIRYRYGPMTESDLRDAIVTLLAESP